MANVYYLMVVTELIQGGFWPLFDPIPALKVRLVFIYCRASVQLMSAAISHHLHSLALDGTLPAIKTDIEFGENFQADILFLIDTNHFQVFCC